MNERYYTYKAYLNSKYHDKVYKLPIHIDAPCPNKDVLNGKDGCAFCSSLGTGFESNSNITPILEQLAYAKDKSTKRYNATKFIGYFQNYTNTNIPVETLIGYMQEVVSFGVVAIDIATRPDCVSYAYLMRLKEFSETSNVELSFEVGLQIANDAILKKMNRGHTTQDFIEGVKLIQSFEFSVCVHLILNLPDSTPEDVKQTIQLMNDLKCDVVKFHSLYIPNDCALSVPFLNRELNIGTSEEYIERVIYSITHLNPNIAISRLVSRIPEENALFSNWGMSWWKIYNSIIHILEEQQLYQGIYLGDDEDETIQPL